MVLISLLISHDGDSDHKAINLVPYLTFVTTDVQPIVLLLLEWQMIQMMHPIRGGSSSMDVIVSSMDIYPIHG